MIAPSTWKTFHERVARLYEQNAPQDFLLRRIEQYRSALEAAGANWIAAAHCSVHH
jgi:hypothetical protein